MPHSSPQPALQQVWPAPLDLSPEQMALAALRHEIDVLDDQLLALFERRLAIAARVGKAKDAPSGPHVKLRPDRERTMGFIGRKDRAPSSDQRLNRTKRVRLSAES